MPASQNEIQRLAFIKYLHHLGVEQTRMSDPLCSISILTFHDSAELFLQLICDSLNIVPPKNIGFTGYWDLIEKDRSKTITHKNEMERLNKLRVQLKHHGVFLSKQAIEEAKIFVNLFFEENTRQIYDINYSQISLVDLVTFETTKNLLKTAEIELKSKNFIDSILNITVAFFQLIEDYEKNKTTGTNRSPFYFGKSLTYHINEDKLSDNESVLNHNIEAIYDSLQELTSALKILALGFDYRKYSKFMLTTPNPDYIKHKSWDPKKELKDITEYDVNFCLNFVIECSLKLQEFDYEYDLKKNGYIVPLDKWF